MTIFNSYCGSTVQASQPHVIRMGQRAVICTNESYKRVENNSNNKVNTLYRCLDKYFFQHFNGARVIQYLRVEVGGAGLEPGLTTAGKPSERVLLA